MLGRTDSRRRLLALLMLFIVGSTALVARTAYWQIVRGAELADRALAQTTTTIEVPSRRGEIYDRTGTILLATTVERDRLVAAPNQLTRAERIQTEDELVRLLGLDAAATATLHERLTSDKSYVILARGIEPSLADAIRTASREKRIVGISLESEPERVYPQAGGGPDSSLAAHLLGFVNRENAGQYGVEQYYQEILAGSPRVLVAHRDINGRSMPETAEVKEHGVIGEDLRLTIDAGLQLALEQELLAAWIADKAKSVSAVVLDPYTGEVYAEATYPSYDANTYSSIAASAPGRFIDPVVSNVYEPGSVFKMMTAVTALEAGVVTRTTKIKDVGTLRLDGGRTKIDNANRKGMGWITFEDGIAYSRNVVAAKVALSLAETVDEAGAMLYDTWTKLGYGRPTGIDVAGEVGGIVRDPGVTPWREIDLANASFGQGVAVTPIQLATAFAALVNGGSLVQPHVVKAIGDTEYHDHRAGAGGGAIHHARSRPDDGPRRGRGAVLPRPDQGSRVLRRRQDGDRADLGRQGQRRARELETQPLQLLVRRIHRPRSRCGRSRHRRPDRGRPTHGRPRRAAGDAGHVVRTLPTDRHQRHHDARPVARPAAGRHRRRLGPVNGGHATLPPVTDLDPSVAEGPARAGPALTADDLVRLTGGRLLARSDRAVRGAAVDSRRIVPGNLFVALPGDRTDGHAHLGEAVERGAAALLVTRPSVDPAALGDVTVIRVADATAALGAVATGWRTRFTPLAVGITGSIAKTSAKEAVAAVLATRFATLKSEGNQNNEIGLPLTVLRLRPEHGALVLEMGMYVGGEIADLAAIGRPSIGVVTAVQAVHLSRIGTLEAVERAKAELVEALPDGRHGRAQRRRSDRGADGRTDRGAGPALRVLRGRRRPRGRGRDRRTRGHAVPAHHAARRAPGRDPRPGSSVGAQRPCRRFGRDRGRARPRRDRGGVAGGLGCATSRGGGPPGGYDRHR